jgi:hypothetical protein
MTEASWLACEDAYPMIDLIQGQSSERKLRLFGAACCRRLWHLLTDRRSMEMIAVAERRADGHASEEEFLAARTAAAEVDNGKLDATHYAEEAASLLSWNADDGYDSGYHVKFLWYDVGFTLGQGKRAAMLVALLRDMVGNPFRPVTVNPAVLAWNDAVIVRLARAAYEERHLPSGELDLQRLAVLADALEEAGAPAELVAHLRSPGPHVRGCFAVDLCLGKT